MMVKELRELLEDYPDDTSVFVLRERLPYGTGGSLMNFEISLVIDQNTNKDNLYRPNHTISSPCSIR